MADLQKYKPLLHDNPLCGIDTYKDTLNLATGACTRIIKKLVLTGEEPWGKSGDGIYAYFGIRLGDSSSTFTTAVCTHYENVDVTKTSPAVGFMLTASSKNLRIRTNDVENVTLNDFTSYLVQQYAAGTPVTIWYVLETATTETITVPSGFSGTEEGYLIQDGTPTPTNPIYPTANYVEIWQHSLRKLTTATEAVENPLYSDGTAITSYTIKGNTIQDGTTLHGVGEPEPDFAIISGDSQTITNWYYSNVRITDVLEAGTYTITYVIDDKTGDANTSVIGYGSLSAYQGDLRSTVVSNVPIAITVTLTLNSGGCLWARFLRTHTPTNFSYVVSQIHVVKGIYPYGYKIPISNGQQSINIYIGDLPLLKSLDGTAVDEISNGTLTRRVDSDGSALPTPTTTQITVPSILTTQGTNSITVDTIVQPSEFTATWTGWHDANVKEWDGSDWQ